MDLTVADVDRLGRVDDARGMRIVDVQPVLLSYEYPPEHVQRFVGGELPGVTTGLVRVATDAGITGLGETYAGYWNPDGVRSWVPVFRDVVLGRDASDVRGAWDACAAATTSQSGAGVGLAVLSALESALWDACGKALGRPVVDLLGGCVHERLPRYASGGLESSEDELRAEISSYASRGFTAAKIRGGVSLEHDVARVEVALEAGIRIALDQVQGTHPDAWAAERAIQVALALEPHDLLWIEEPCAVRDVEGYVAVREALRTSASRRGGRVTPVAGGEPLIGYERFVPLLDAGALDIVQPDASHCGGILQERKVAAHADARGVGVAVHAWAAGACLMANYHVGFASPATRWLEYPPQPNPFVEGLLVEPLRVDGDGFVLPPSAPGLGVEVTPELEERYPFRPGCHYRLGNRRRA